MILLCLLMGLPRALPGSASATEPLSLGHCCFIASPYRWNLIQFSVSHFSLGRSLDLVCLALTSPCGFNLHFHEQPARLNRTGILHSETAAPTNLTVSPAQRNSMTFIYLIYLFITFPLAVCLQGASQCSSFHFPLSSTAPDLSVPSSFPGLGQAWSD